VNQSFTPGTRVRMTPDAIRIAPRGPCQQTRGVVTRARHTTCEVLRDGFEQPEWYSMTWWEADPTARVEAQPGSREWLEARAMAALFARA